MQTIEQVNDVPKRGRPVGAKDRGNRMSKRELADRLQRLQAIGALAGTSAKVLHALGDASYWLQVIAKLEEQGDWDKIGAIVQFHQQMRDGRPHQQINVTATNIHVSAEQIARARAVVRELSPSIRGELKAKGDEPNAAEGQGGKKDGSV